MGTNYPGAIDSLTNPSASGGDTLDDPPHDTQHADANDAIEAIETELGVNPRGSEATVRARLDAIESATSKPVTADDTVTVHTGTLTTVTGGALEEIFDLAGAHDLLGGSFYGISAGVRLTIDGTVVLDVTSESRGEDNTQSVEFSALALPPARSETSLKLELRNTSGGSRNFGWRVFTRAV